MFQQAINDYLTTHHFDKLNLKAVLFDMDGVLFDSMKNHAKAWHEAMKQYGMHLSPEEAYLHEGRTGAATINIVSSRQRNHEATEEDYEAAVLPLTEIPQCCSAKFLTLPGG